MLWSQCGLLLGSTTSLKFTQLPLLFSPLVVPLHPHLTFIHITTQTVFRPAHDAVSQLYRASLLVCSSVFSSLVLLFFSFKCTTQLYMPITRSSKLFSVHLLVPSLLLSHLLQQSICEAKSHDDLDPIITYTIIREIVLHS